VADQVFNAGLDLGLGRHRVDRLWKFAETTNNGNHDIGDTPAPYLIYETHQNLVPSVCSIQMPGISLIPYGRTPSAIWSIFKPSGVTWRLGKCDQVKI
jgi:hypothetical protein